MEDGGSEDVAGTREQETQEESEFKVGHGCGVLHERGLQEGGMGASGVPAPRGVLPLALAIATGVLALAREAGLGLGSGGDPVRAGAAGAALAHLE